MKIDITQRPPADIYQGRGKYLFLSLTFLALAFGGGALIAHTIFSVNPPSAVLENIAVALIVVSAIFFFYFAEKLKAYKKLGPRQRERLAELTRQHAEVASYCALVEKSGREPLLGEYEACKDWVDELEHEEQEG